ncbi:hypothetical protein KC358_g67 [Hortaea werneckii]|nr:hypothetical protein KC358_g67 [Hortaea werneckii]
MEVRVRVRQSRSTRIIDNAAALPPCTAGLLSFRRLDVAGAFTFDTSTTRLTLQRAARQTPINIISDLLTPSSPVAAWC